MWFGLRAEVRHRWRALLALSLLLGIIGGAVGAAAAAARRTDNVAQRFSDEYKAYDVNFANSGDAGLAPVEPAQLESLPFVEASGRYRLGYVDVNEGTALIVPKDGAIGDSIQRLKVLDGDLPDPSRADEVAISLDAAREAGIEVGDTVKAYGDEGEPDPDAVAPNAFRVTAIVASPNDIALPPPPYQALYGTPALYDAYARDPTEEAGPDGILLRFRHGAQDMPAFRDAYAEIFGGELLVSDSAEDYQRGLRRSTRQQASGIWFIAGLLALSGALAAFQVLVRDAYKFAPDVPVRRAIGATRADLVRGGAARGIAVGVGAALVAAAGVIASSVFTPAGLARTVEPDPGLRVDSRVVGLTLVLTLGVTVVLATIAAALVVRREYAARRVRRTTDLAARLTPPLPVTSATGFRFALTPSATGASRGIVGVAIGIAVLAGSVTFAASRNEVLNDPHQYGWPWDFVATNYGGPFRVSPDSDEGADALREIPGVRSAAVGSFGVPLLLDGDETGAIGLDVIVGDGEEVLPPMTAGEAPLHAGEIALGRGTARALGLGIGDSVTAQLPGIDVTAELRVVGIVVMPIYGQGTELGTGALLPNTGTLEAFGLDPAEVGGVVSEFMITLEPDADRDSILPALKERFAGDETTLVEVARREPGDLVNFGRIGNLPLLLGIVLAFFAGVVLVHTLATSVGRRRHDLATLRSLGFVRSQLWSTVLWQAVVIVVLALAVGLVAGVVGGRVLWTNYAEDLGVVASAVVPVVALAVVTASALVVTLLVAAVPAGIAARTRPAALLRSE